MEKYKFVLLRHGESQWNLENRFTGWTDVGLTGKGIAEAKFSGTILKKEGYTLDLFDCTYYQDIDAINLGKNANQERIDNRNAPAFSTKELTDNGIKPKWGIKEDFTSYS